MGGGNYLSTSFVEKCLTGAEDHANKSRVSLKEISRWQPPPPTPFAHIATAPFLQSFIVCQAFAHPLSHLRPHNITLRQQGWYYYYYSHSVDYRGSWEVPPQVLG